MKQVETEIVGLRDGAVVRILRGRKVESKLRLGPNHVHAFITKPDGTIIDLGISKNLLTNAGRDLWAAAFGHAPMKGGALTAAAAASATPAGGGMTVDQYKGWRVICPVTGLTTPPVYGNVASNSATVLTLDQWWKEDDTVGATPAGTNGYFLLPVCVPRFMALSMDAAAPNAADTVLAAEITTGGCARAKATYAHTGGSATYAMSNSFTVTAPFTAIHKMALLTALVNGIMGFETVLNSDATVGIGDTLNVTDTVTLTG